MSSGLWTSFAANAAATPMRLISTPAPAPTTLEALAKAGQLSGPLFPHPSFTYGGISTSLPKDINASIMKDVTEFSRRDAAISVYTWWQRRDKSSKGLVSAKVYDAANRLRVESKAVKGTIGYTPTRFSTTFTPGNLDRGIYRVDVLWEGQGVWRGFFTIVD